MSDILKDDARFRTSGKIPQYDRPNFIERRLQSLLLRLKKSKQIGDEFYKKDRPTGSETPRMYSYLRYTNMELSYDPSFP